MLFLSNLTFRERFYTDHTHSLMRCCDDNKKVKRRTESKDHVNACEQVFRCSYGVYVDDLFFSVSRIGWVQCTDGNERDTVLAR